MIHQMIRENEAEYIKYLREADAAYEDGGNVELDNLESYLADFLFNQLPKR